MKDKDLVYLVALDVRAWAELYQKTSPGRYWEGLGGLCGIASGKLMHDLAKVNVKAQYVIGNSHCYLYVGDYVVDITATQFYGGFPKIMIEHKDSPVIQNSYWHKEWAVCDTMEEVDYQMRSWPEHQRPFQPGKEPT